MALTTTVRLALEGKRFDQLFLEHEARYESMAHTAYGVMKDQVPGGHPTVDDVKKVLQPMLELDPSLRNHLATKRCTEKHWYGDFTDYVLDVVMQPTAKLQTPAAGGANGT